MTSPPRKSSASGGAHLTRRSALLKRIQDQADPPRLLIVEDREQDARFIETSLRQLFGRRAKILVARNMRELKAVAAVAVDAVILDDRMDAGTTADTTIPLLRKAGHAGAIVVVSALLTHSRQAELRRLGVSHALLKDDADGTRLAEIIVAALDDAKQVR